MTRPSKNNVAYFPHDTEAGSKLRAVEKKFRSAGYIVYYRLLEYLGRAEYHYLSLHPVLVDMFAVDCHITTEELEEILELFVSLGLIHKELYEDHNVLFSEYFLRTFATAYEKRKTTCIDLETLGHKLGLYDLRPYYNEDGLVLPGNNIRQM